MDHHYHQDPNMDPYRNYPPPYEQIYKPKKKWFACFLSFIIPGSGHMYLGLMQRGLLFMLLIAFNISLITLIVSSGNPNVALVTIVSLCIPITYFYTIFDALQYTDKVNYVISLGGSVSDAAKQLSSNNNMGFLLVAVGGWFFLLSVNPKWLTLIFESAISTYLGGIILVVAGVIMILFNQRKR